MNELANIPGNIIVVLTQQGITNARSSEEDQLRRFITILRGDYKSGKKILFSWPIGQQLYTHTKEAQ